MFFFFFFPSGCSGVAQTSAGYLDGAAVTRICWARSTNYTVIHQTDYYLLCTKHKINH